MLDETKNRRQELTTLRQPEATDRGSTKSNYNLTLPGGQTVEYRAPVTFHIPRFLRDRGLKGYEPISLAFMLALVQTSSGPFFDIGANIGVFALSVASALGRQCVAYEPFDEAAGVLEETSHNYKLPILVRRAAVGAHRGRSQFYLSAKSDMSNSLNPSFRTHKGEVSVEVTTIDDEAVFFKPSVIKIDTETTEMDVLHGATSTFAALRPSILLEILDTNIGNQVRNLFGSINYKIVELNNPKLVLRVTGGETSVEGDLRNWVALPDEPSEALFDRVASWHTKLSQLPVRESGITK